MLSVSVIIPTYNRADYLPQALESAFDQSLSPLEVIVVDDGSTDGTASLVRAFRPAVRYLKQEHRGVSAARNLGLGEAQGQIIAWLDADDLWEQDFLATLVPLLEADPELDGVYCGCSYIDAAGNALPQSDLRVVESTALFPSLIEGNFIATPTVIARRRCYEQVGGFDTNLGICEDYDMWLRLAKEFAITGLAAPLVKVRIHDSNSVRDSAAFIEFRLAVVQKHFGPPEGPPSRWPEAKRRAYAMAFREVAIRHGQDSDPSKGQQYLAKAAAIWPCVLGRLDTYYELACGNQPRGNRGQTSSLDIEGNGSVMLKHLDLLFAAGDPALQAMRPMAYGNAYLALAMLSDQSGTWNEARRYMMRAVRANPSLLASRRVIRRLAKLHLGKRLTGLVRTERALDTGE